MRVEKTVLNSLEALLPAEMLARVHRAAEEMAAAKAKGGRIVVVTGSGPNVHEGVTTLLAELMRAGIVDGVTTSSAVVSHEMGGTLDKVKRCNGVAVGVAPFFLPLGNDFELTEMAPAYQEEIARHIVLDTGLIERLKSAEGRTIIKAAGNLGYPVGLWLEHLAMEVATLARAHGRTFEEVAGLGADERTMIGIGAKKGLPVLVTIPQLIGGGLVGLSIGDSISITERAGRLARMMGSADIIIESGVALTQEIHDGPFERYTGHGLWSSWMGHDTYSLEGKKLIRIDLDPALETVCQAQRGGGAVQAAIADGLPKTKLFKVPFRMEMSGFARHPNSMAVVGDIGVVWPLMAVRVAEILGIELEFVSYPQQTPQGQAMREAIVRDVKPLDRAKMLAALAKRG